MRILVSVSAFTLLFLAPPLAGQIPQGMEGPFEPHPEAVKAISRLYSPYCPGFMLEVCPSPNAAVLRDSIHALAYEGWTADELVEWLLGNHGEQWLAAPERSGSGLWAWLLPPLALLVGVGLVTVVLRRSVLARDTALPSPPSAGEEERLSGEQEARLRSAIHEIELSEDPSF